MNTPTQPLQQLKIEKSQVQPRRAWWRRRWVAGIVVVLVLAALLLRPGKLEVNTTSVVTSYPSAQYAQLTASGYVVAQRRAAVASKGTGRLVWLGVREGSHVKQGDVLARLDSSDVQAALQQAQAAVHQAQAGVTQAQVERANAEAELKRSQGLLAQGFISAQGIDTAMTRFNAAKAAVATAEAAVEVSKAQLRVQQVNLDYTDIRAPFTGVVLVKNANVGDMITPFSSAASSQGAVVTMADMSTLEVEADVAESNLAKAQIGQPVEIALDALPGVRFRGSVVGIVPTVDRAKATVLAKIRFEKLDERILPEMSAKVTILSQAPSDADMQPLLAVNPKAVVQRDGKSVLFRVKDDHVELVPITPARKLGDALVEVKGEVKSGDKVVLEPSDKLVADAKVTVATK